MTETTHAEPVLTLSANALLGESAAAPGKELVVSVSDAAASTPQEVESSFRDLLSPTKLAILRKNAPSASVAMVRNPNAILDFGSDQLAKLKAHVSELAEMQGQVELPEADRMINDLMRKMDGYEAKFRNKKAEDLGDKIVAFFRGTTYSFKTLVREAQPIEERIAMVERSLLEWEGKLSDNVTGAQVLYESTMESIRDVVNVLATFEEIIDVTRAEAKRLNDAVLQAEKDNPGEAALVVVEFDGQRISLQDLSARRNSYAGALAEMEQSWFDWRQQYFLEYAQSYNALNLGQVSLTLQRRMKTFRTMGIVQAQKALIAWKNAEIARAGAEQAQAFVEGTNKFIQSAATAGSDATIAAARAAQTPLVSEETVFVVYDSLRRSAEGMLAADTWGREQRAKINSAMQTGEAAIQTTFSATRSALIKNALKELGEPLDAPPAEDKSGEEILTLLATSAK